MAAWLRLWPHCYADAKLAVLESYYKQLLHLISCGKYRELSLLYICLKATCSIAGQALLNASV